MSRRALRRAVLVGLLLSVLAAGAAGAAVRGNPVITAAIGDNEVHPGDTTTLELTLANKADLDWASLTNPDLTQQVQTARGVHVEVEARNAPVEIEAGDHLLGSLAGGASVGLPVRLHVAEDADPGTYDLRVVVDYTYTSQITTEGFAFDRDRQRRLDVPIEVTAAPRFTVVSATDDLRAGETGTVSVTVENAGGATANRASLSLAAEDGDVAFGDARSPRASSYVGSWAPGERRTVVYRVRTAPADAPRDYTLTAAVDYRDENDVAKRSRPLAVGVSAAATPTFAFDGVTATLRVGDRGTVAGTLVNTGDTAVRDATVVLDPPAPGIRPTTTERAVGDLAPGESASFAFPVDVAGGVEPGPRQLSLVPRYTTARGESVAVEPGHVRADVAPEREPFALSVVNGTIAPDQDNYHLSVDVRNAGDVARTDVVLTLRVPRPFTSVTPTAYVARLAPGETTRLTFELSADEDAVAGTYPVSVNVTSDTPARDNALDGPYLLPVVVAEQGGVATDLSIVGLAALIAVLVLGAGWWWLRG